MAVLATLDTKYEEAAYLRDLIEQNECETVLIDCSLRPSGGIMANIRAEELLEQAGFSAAAFASLSKDEAIAEMQQALREKLLRMHKDGGLDGVISVGGVQGTVIATAAMQALPVGVPKYMVSTVANGNAVFGPFVGVSDMAIMHSVVDIAGLNFVLRKVLHEAAGAICGMVKLRSNEKSSGNVVGITMAGVTTACAMQLKRALEGQGYEVLVFHCNGVGAHVMENLVAAGDISYVIDLSPHDIMDALFEGLMPSYEERLRPVVRAGIPLLFIPGSMDFILYNGVDKVPADKRDRAYFKHNSIHTHVRASREELRAAGRFVGERLRDAGEQVRVLIPAHGFSQQNSEGCALYDPQADAGFLEGLADSGGGLAVETVQAHINDQAFAARCMEAFEELAARRENTAALGSA